MNSTSGTTTNDELQRQHDLTQHQQSADPATAIKRRHHSRRHGRNQPGHHPSPQGRSRMSNPSITICPAMVAVSVAFCPDASSATQTGVPANDALNRAEKLICVADVGDVLMPAAVKRRRAQDQNCRINEKKRRTKPQSNLSWPNFIAIALPVSLRSERPRLGNAGVKIKIMRHHRRPQECR